MAAAAARPASCSRCRVPAGSRGAGDSSTTFWWRRCSEQSRSPSTRMPSGVPSTCTSTCRPRSTYRSTNTVPSPNADSASARACSTSPAQRGRGVRTTRIPRPPPPALAFTSSGRSASVARSGSMLSSTGTPASATICLASTFEPIRSIASGCGPTQVSPTADHGAREVGVLGEEPVARVHRVGAGPLGRLDEQVGAQVGVGGCGARQPDGDVGLRHVRQPGVGVGVHRHGLDAERPAGAEDAGRDLGAVGDEQRRITTHLHVGRVAGARNERLRIEAPEPLLPTRPHWRWADRLRGFDAPVATSFLGRGACSTSSRPTRRARSSLAAARLIMAGTPRTGRCRRSACSRSPRGRCRARCGCRGGR